MDIYILHVKLNLSAHGDLWIANVYIVDVNYLGWFLAVKNAERGLKVAILLFWWQIFAIHRPVLGLLLRKYGWDLEVILATVFIIRSPLPIVQQCTSDHAPSTLVLRSHSTLLRRGADILASTFKVSYLTTYCWSRYFVLTLCFSFQLDHDSRGSRSKWDEHNISTCVTMLTWHVALKAFSRLKTGLKCLPHSTRVQIRLWINL